MIATEVCPFSDPEILTQIADEAGKVFVEQRTNLTNQLVATLDEGQRRLLNELDNIAIAEINAVQAATITKVICEPCRAKGQLCRSPHK